MKKSFFNMFNACFFYKMLLYILCLVMCNNVTAETYYINSRVGGDDNSGTTKEAVWKSFKNLENNIFKPGDSILFAKGSSFPGEKYKL